MAGVRQLSTLWSKTLSVPVQDWQTLKVTLHHKGQHYLLECEARTSLQALQDLVSQVCGVVICRLCCKDSTEVAAPCCQIHSVVFFGCRVA